MKHLIKVAVAAALLIAAATSARADQSSVVQPVTGPHTMADLNTNYLNPALRALLSHSSGPTAPTNGPSGAPMVYQIWADTSTSPTTLRMYDGAQWVAIGVLNPSAHTLALYAALTGACQTAAGTAVVTCPGLLSTSNSWSAQQNFTLALGFSGGAGPGFNPSLIPVFGNQGGALTWNKSGGNGEVDFWNLFNSAASIDFSFYHYLTSTTQTNLMDLGLAGLALHVPFKPDAPVGAAYGGTGCSAPSGTCVDNVSGFTGTGFVQRTGPGTYSQSYTAPTPAAADNSATVPTTAFLAANAVRNDLAQTYTAAQLSKLIANLAQIQAPTVASAPSTYAANLANAVNFTLTLSASSTLSFSGIAAGVTYTFEVIQPASGGPFTVTWPSQVSWGTAGAPTLSTAASAKDDVSCYAVDATHLHCVLIGKGF